MLESSLCAFFATITQRPTSTIEQSGAMTVPKFVGSLPRALVLDSNSTRLRWIFNLTTLDPSEHFSLFSQGLRLVQNLLVARLLHLGNGSVLESLLFSDLSNMPGVSHLYLLSELVFLPWSTSGKIHS